MISTGSSRAILRYPYNQMSNIWQHTIKWPLLCSFVQERWYSSNVLVPNRTHVFVANFFEYRLTQWAYMGRFRVPWKTIPMRSCDPQNKNFLPSRPVHTMQNCQNKYTLTQCTLIKCRLTKCRPKECWLTKCKLTKCGAAFPATPLIKSSCKPCSIQAYVAKYKSDSLRRARSQASCHYPNLHFNNQYK